jgi:PhnB protein
MSPSVKWIPDSYRTVTPQVRVKGADKQIDFLKKAFDVKETERLTMRDGFIAQKVQGILS